MNRHVVSMKGTKGDFKVEPGWEEVPPDSLSLFEGIAIILEMPSGSHLKIWKQAPCQAMEPVLPGPCSQSHCVFVPDALDPHGLWPGFHCASVLWFLSSRKNKLRAL